MFTVLNYRFLVFVYKCFGTLRDRLNLSVCKKK